MNKFFSFLLIVFLTLVACTPQPVWRPAELHIDSNISNPIILHEDVLSTEPTVFVRSMSHEASGAKDLDALIENRLEASKHRLVARSDNATIKILVQLVYQGSAERLNTDQLLADGYGTLLPSMSKNNEQPAVYDSIAVVDVKVVVSTGADVSEQSCRILVGSRLPVPAMDHQEIRAALLERAAAQISVFLEY